MYFSKIEGIISLISAETAKMYRFSYKIYAFSNWASAIYAEEHGFLQVLPEHIDGAFNEVDIDRVLTLAPLCRYIKNWCC